MSAPYDRPTNEPGGMECMECGVIFVGAEWHSRCAVCEAKHQEVRPMTTPTDRARPEDIPEDVWAIARKAYDDACLAEPEYGAQAVIARAILAAEKRGAAREREVALGAIDTLRESLMEGLMTDADLTDADRVAMNHQLEALGVAAATIRNRESDT